MFWTSNPYPDDGSATKGIVCCNDPCWMKVAITAESRSADRRLRHQPKSLSFSPNITSLPGKGRLLDIEPDAFDLRKMLQGLLPLLPAPTAFLKSTPGAGGIHQIVAVHP